MIPDCPFCGSDAIINKHNGLVTCQCLRKSNTWIPRHIWMSRKQRFPLRLDVGYDSAIDYNKE